jgi:hypothetical protein
MNNHIGDHTTVLILLSFSAFPIAFIVMLSFFIFVLGTMIVILRTHVIILYFTQKGLKKTQRKLYSAVEPCINNVNGALDDNDQKIITEKYREFSEGYNRTLLRCEETSEEIRKVTRKCQNLACQFLALILKTASWTVIILAFLVVTINFFHAFR